MSNLQRTPFFELHARADARMAPFAGYDMPIRYEPGPIAEHLHTRERAGLFDISHMGLVEVSGTDHRQWLESLFPTNVTGLAEGQMRYSFLTNPTGGIIDDAMLTGHEDRIDIVFNASRKAVDVEHLRQHASDDIVIDERPDVAMLALQGPAAADVLSSLAIEVPDVFLTGRAASHAGAPLWVSRSGYTGEDGFELQGAHEPMVSLAGALLDLGDVAWTGLGARDSLRLEAGLCLYGNDLSESISPIEAGLRWAIPKRRREEGGFLGSDRILAEIADGPTRRRVGLKPTGRAPVRDGAALTYDGREIGHVSSGGYGPTVGGPIAMGYVAAEYEGTEVAAHVRGKEIVCELAALPFVPHRYVRGDQ